VYVSLRQLLAANLLPRFGYVSRMSDRQRPVGEPAVYLVAAKCEEVFRQVDVKHILGVARLGPLMRPQKRCSETVVTKEPGGEIGQADVYVLGPCICNDGGDRLGGNGWLFLRNGATALWEQNRIRQPVLCGCELQQAATLPCELTRAM
jgi:hypothetical protein